MILNSEFDRAIITFAFRYTLGRHSYAPSLMMDKLDEIWNQLHDFDKELILREIIEHKEFMERINEGKEWSFNDDYDLKEWVSWRERRIYKDEHPI